MSTEGTEMKKIRATNFNSYLRTLGIAYYLEGPEQVQAMCRRDIRDCASSVRVLFEQIINASIDEVIEIMNISMKDFINEQQ